MNRLLAFSLAGAFAVGITGFVVVMAAPSKGPVFIAGDRPVTEDQIRQRLQTDGWSNIQIRREGRYFEAVASKNGENSKIDVDSQTGRLRPADDDDDD